MADLASPYLPWRIAGSYLESCNCEAICPCRRVGDTAGGRSTYGVCFGALSWLIEDGRAGDFSLAGLAVVLVYRYDDDEPGSPWQLVLHVDERGDDDQREALAGIFLGGLGGERVRVLPWVRKPSDVHAVRVSPVMIARDDRGGSVQIGRAVSMRASRPVETGQRVSCIVPGHDREGAELYADELRVRDEPFEWELAGNCAFTTAFEYVSDAV
jgi:hypothetical protein